MRFPAHNSVVSKILRGDFSRDVVADLFWVAFPEARSARDLAVKAEPVIGLSRRQIQDVLRKDADLKAKHLLVLIALVGWEIVLDRVFGPEINP